MTAISKSKEARSHQMEEFIHIKGASTNNLKAVEVKFPKNKFIVVTGLSGSGKSSLVMDTLYAEGQRRYVESLSSYARQFLNRMKKPEVDFIKGLCPAIAIEQRKTHSNTRSTVGSMTEINDYIRLLYARIGKMYSPISGEEVTKQQVSDVVDFIMNQQADTKILLFIPFRIHDKSRTLRQELDLLLQKGYTRVRRKDAKSLEYIQDILEKEEKELAQPLSNMAADSFQILVDRFVVKPEEEENKKRIADSVHTAFLEAEGDCIVEVMGGKSQSFNNRFELDGIEFPELTPQLFNYNNPYGACPKCEGYGRVLGIDEFKVIPDPSRSIYDGAIAAWSGAKGSKWLRQLLSGAVEDNIDIHTPYEELSEEEKELIWEGSRHFKGIYAYFKKIEEKAYKIQNRVLLSRYRGRTKCPECKGTRLRKEALYVKIDGKSIKDIIFLPIDELKDHFQALKQRLNTHDITIAKRLLTEIEARLSTMVKIGLGYLTLERLSNTLSGGETQRIHLTRTLSSNLTHSMYILDEPSIGLHPKDSAQLINVLKELRDLGNTVIVVEHEEEIIRAADHIIEMGPNAGLHGGQLVFSGAYDTLDEENTHSYTRDYLSGKRQIPVPKVYRDPKHFIQIKGARHHNLKQIDVQFPLHVLTVVTGVSGSGKSTLVHDILYPLLMQEINQEFIKKVGNHKDVNTEVLKNIDKVEYIDQNPIGRSSRSNPVTYIKVYDKIRKLMANQRLAKLKGYKPGHFSFNVDGGRCETCEGEGATVVEMQFLADVKLECESCKGRKFKDEILEVEYNGKNIFEILELSVDEAIPFFEKQKDIASKLQSLQNVGLGYVKLGQSSSTLSGGEAQRVKLAYYLTKDKYKDRILFIFDEPTTGLHFHDINKLMTSLDALIEHGHTVIVVEHNMDVIKNADWILDLGPEGGKNGGRLLYQGPLKGILEVEESYTGQYLKEKLSV